MKDDFEYAINSVRQPSRYDCMRIAVLTPLLGDTSWAVPLSRKDADDAVIAAMKKIRTMWHRRLFELRDAKWPPIHDRPKSHLRFMMNCPPFGVETGVPNMRCCKRSLICPFCYARECVLEAYLHFERFFYADTAPATKPAVGDWQLIEFRAQGDVSLDLDYSVENIRYQCLAQRTYIVHPLCRRLELKRCAAPYGVVQHQIEPLASGSLCLRRSGVLLTHKLLEKSQVVSGARDHFVAHDLARVRALKHTLALAVGRTFAYPDRMMFAPAEVVMTVMEALYKTRLRGVYGFRRDADAQSKKHD